MQKLIDFNPVRFCLLGAATFTLFGCGSSSGAHANAADASTAGKTSGGGASSTGQGGSGNSGTGHSGSSNAGGSGNSPPSPMHVVTPCPSAEGGAEAGTNGKWEEITPPGIQLVMLNGKNVYGTQAVLINPFDTSNVIVGVDSQGLFKSTDCGSTWSKLDTGQNGSILDTGAQWSMVMAPKHPDIIYAVNGYGSQIGLWKSTNGGVDWSQLFPPDSQVAKVVQYDFTSIVSIDPADETHLVVSFHAQCMSPYSPSCQAESKDSGATWNLIKSPPITNFEGAGPMVLNATSWLYSAPSDGMWLTTDNGANWKNVTPTGASGSHYQLYHSPKGNYFLGSGWGVLMSADGMSWKLLPNSGGQLTGLTGNGKHMWVSQQYGGQYYTASEDNPTVWTMMPTPGRPTSDAGAYLMQYDPDHHLLYATEQRGGLWRVSLE